MYLSARPQIFSSRYIEELEGSNQEQSISIDLALRWLLLLGATMSENV